MYCICGHVKDSVQLKILFFNLPLGSRCGFLIDYISGI